MNDYELKEKYNIVLEKLSTKFKNKNIALINKEDFEILSIYRNKETDHDMINIACENLTQIFKGKDECKIACACTGCFNPSCIHSWHIHLFTKNCDIKLLRSILIDYLDYLKKEKV